MTNMTLQHGILICGEAIHADPSEAHEWTMTTCLVSRGYGVSESVIRDHKRNHSEELIEGKHWVVQNIDTLGGMQKMTIWTKKGVVRLGFFIRSERARMFRDMAEDLVIKATEQPDLFGGFKIPQTLEEALELALKQEREKNRLEAKVVELIPMATYAEVVMDSNTLLNTTAVSKVLGVGAPTLHNFLRDKKVIRRNGKEWVPTYEYQGRDDLMKIVTTTREVQIGTEQQHTKTFHQLKWTEAGAKFVREMWRNEQ